MRTIFDMYVLIASVSMACFLNGYCNCFDRLIFFFRFIISYFILCHNVNGFCQIADDQTARVVEDYTDDRQKYT